MADTAPRQRCAIRGVPWRAVGMRRARFMVSGGVYAYGAHILLEWYLFTECIIVQESGQFVFG